MRGTYRAQVRIPACDSLSKGGTMLLIVVPFFIWGFFTSPWPYGIIAWVALSVFGTVAQAPRYLHPDAPRGMFLHMAASTFAGNLILAILPMGLGYLISLLFH